MKHLFIILVMALSASSCTFSQSPKDKKRDNYIIPDSLLLFFPDKSDKYKDLKIIKLSENASKSEIPLFLSEFDPIKLLEVYQCEDKKSLQQLQKEYRSQSLFSVKSENNNYFVIEDARTLFSTYDSLQLKERYSKLDEKSLIFYFKSLVDDTPFLYDSTTISSLPVGYEILVLKSGSDFVLPEDHLYDWSVLPENLRHGYRSGVAFKEGEPYIVYWTVAW